MYPHERSLVRTLADKPFTIIGVNSDKASDISESVCKPKNLSWRSFTNNQGDKKISDEWKVAGWPTTYLIDKDGIIRHKGLRGSALDKAIEGLMAEMDIEVNLSDIDHEAEDEKAMEAYKKAIEAEAKEKEEKEKAAEEKEVADTEASSNKSDKADNKE